MNRNYFLELTDYIIWTDSKVIYWLQQINDEQWEQIISSSFTSIKSTVLHIASAEKIWIDFWKNVPNPVYLSAEFKGSKDELIAIWKNTIADLRTFIENYPEENYTTTVTFKVRNEEWKMEFWQTFTHFLNHATYHRGQLVTLLRQAGFSDFSSTDLATYYHLRQK